jgi:hypothetical protein
VPAARCPWLLVCVLPGLPLWGHDLLLGGVAGGAGTALAVEPGRGVLAPPLTEGGALFKSQLKAVKKEEVNRARVYGSRDARGAWVCGAFGGSIDASAVVG